MSAHLYRAAASAELFGALVYVSLSAFAFASALCNWGGAWFPLLAIACIVSFRLALLHWRERSKLINEAKQIEKND